MVLSVAERLAWSIADEAVTRSAGDFTAWMQAHVSLAGPEGISGAMSSASASAGQLAGRKRMRCSGAAGAVRVSLEEVQHAWAESPRLWARLLSHTGHSEALLHNITLLLCRYRLPVGAALELVCSAAEPRADAQRRRAFERIVLRLMESTRDVATLRGAWARSAALTASSQDKVRQLIRLHCLRFRLACDEVSRLPSVHAHSAVAARMCLTVLACFPRVCILLPGDGSMAFDSRERAASASGCCWTRTARQRPLTRARCHGRWRRR
jgi:hypothetical protein